MVASPKKHPDRVDDKVVIRVMQVGPRSVYQFTGIDKEKVNGVVQGS
jgi:hypothetical protein